MFGPPEANADWNAFGWSNDIISTDGGDSFVVIGEPGRDFPEGGERTNDGAVYVYKHNN